MYRYVDMPLYEDAFYTYSITLEGQSYIIEMLYVEKMELYTLSLYTANGTPLLNGVGIVPYFPIARNYAIEGLSGYFTLVSKAREVAEPYKVYPDKLSEYYNMYYVYESEEG